ncbi:MAG: hypothetical protein ACOX0A_03830 [Thermoguttaceae bacterium]|jgi:hypothetical protein
MMDKIIVAAIILVVVVVMIVKVVRTLNGKRTPCCGCKVDGNCSYCCSNLAKALKDAEETKDK